MDTPMAIDDIMALGPCYTRDRVTNLFGGRETILAKDAAALSIPSEDKVWYLSALLSGSQQHEAACYFAESAICLQTGLFKAALQTGIDAKRAWLRGEISDGDLIAARDNARDDAINAAINAAVNASVNAGAIDAINAAWTATWFAARDYGDAFTRAAGIAAVRSVARSAARAIAWDADKTWGTAWIAVEDAVRNDQIEYLLGVIERSE